jgi:hypothetical protein
VVSGSLALIQAANPSFFGKESQEVLLAAADNIEKLNPEYSGKLGRGRVNVYSAVVLAEKIMKEKVESIIVSPASSAAQIYVKGMDMSGNVLKEFNVYDSNIKSGIKIAAGTFDNDIKDSLVSGSGAGQPPEVMVFSLVGELNEKFFAYDKNFRGGVNVAAGDIDGDGVDEIITGAGNGGGPQVRIFDASGKVKGHFFAYDKNFAAEVNVAAGISTATEWMK